MKVVFPVTRQNCRLYEQLGLLFERTGIHKGHGLVVIACPSAVGEAATFIEKVKRYFGTVEIYEAASEVTNTHGGRNRIFRDAAMLLHKHKNQSPWIWMEHAYPTDRNWLEMVRQEWEAKPVLKSFLGCLETAYRCKRDERGNVLKDRVEDFEDIGQFMRFGVYPPDFLDICPYARYQNGVPEIPFEVDLRGTIAPLVHPSRTITSVWASRNWNSGRNGYLVGEQDPEFELEIRRSEKTATKLDGVAILHGCRDGTLGAVLMSKQWNKTDHIPPVDVRSPSADQSATIASLRARVRELEAELAALRSASEEGSVEDQASDAEASDASVSEAPVEPGEIASIADAEGVEIPTVEAEVVDLPDPEPEPQPVQEAPKRRRGRPRKQKEVNV